MIVAFSLPPTPGEVVIGVTTVLAGALLTSVAVFLARRTRNWLQLVTATGGLLIVAGVVGQRTAATGVHLGPWDAGIAIPVVGLHLDAVTAAGVIVGLAGITLTLLFERLPGQGIARPPPLHRPLEDDDAV